MESNAQSFDYKLTVHQLRPWPLSISGSSSPQFIAIGWQRGAQTGSIDAVKAKVTAKGYGVYMFNEELTISANLRKNPPGGAPGYEKKFLQLAAINVHRGMTEDRPLASVGTVVINLADFTDTKRGPKKLAFRVSVGREVTSALASIGKPEAPSLIVTMQCTRKGQVRTLERDASFSSRGSRITGDLSAFFTKDKNSARQPVPEEEEEPEQPPPPTRPPVAALESFGAASAAGSTPGLPPSDLRATPANPMRRLDSDGFEIDSSEDAVVAAHKRTPSTPTQSALRKPPYHGHAAAAASGHHDVETNQAVIPSTVAPPGRDKNRASFPMLDEINSKKNRVGAMLSGGGAAPEGRATADPAHEREETPTGLDRKNNSGPRFVPGDMDAADAPAAAAAATPREEEDENAPRRKTGKTTYIRDWLGTAEPAPGEGPSVRFPKASDSPEAKPTWRRSGGAGTFGVPSTLQEEDVAGGGEEEAAAGRGEEVGRRQLAQSLSMSRNHDLRMVLDHDRIQKESESFMKDLDDAAAAAEEAAEAMDAAPPLRASKNGRTTSRSAGHASEKDSGTIASGGVPDDDGEGAAGKRRFAWQRKRSSALASDVPTVAEDRRDEPLLGELPEVDLRDGHLGSGVDEDDLEDVALKQAAAEEWVEEEKREAEAKREADRIAEQEERFAAAQKRTAEAEKRAAEMEEKAAAMEQQLLDAQERTKVATEEAEAAQESARAAQRRAEQSERLAREAQERAEEELRATEASQQRAAEELQQLKAEVKKQEAAAAAAATAAATAAAAASDSAADTTTHDVGAASSSIAMEQMDGLSTKLTRKPGRELKWRRTSQAGSAALNTAHSAVLDDAELKKIDNLEQELRLVGVLETAVHCCSCIHQPEGTMRSRSHVTHTPARRLFRALVSLPQAQAQEFVPVLLQSIRQRAGEAWAEDVPVAFFWWSNVQMLRVFLQQLEKGAVSTVGDCSWAKAALEPGLEEVSEEIFNGLVDMLWEDVMLPMQERSAARKAHGGDNTEEEAMMRWMACLDVANDRVSRALLRVEGFSALLLPLVQAALLARIDFLFYSNIMSVGVEKARRSAFGGEGGWSVPPHMLPFTLEGHVSFQTGMQLKMAVMHLSHWAHDHDLRDREGAMLYPYTRSTADALMMKKDLLLDDETRLSVASALPVPALLHLLSHFAADEFSPDEVDASVLQHLREVAKGLPDETGELQSYVGPDAEELEEFADREIADGGTRRRGPRAPSMAQISVQIGDDSDAELQDLTSMSAGDATARFRLVQELWGGSQDRRDE